MSYENVELKNIEGVRKVRWDALWHVLYKVNGKETWDRVEKSGAMKVLEKLENAKKG